MALILTDGFDTYSTEGELVDRGWVYSAGTPSLITLGTTEGRYGGGALQLLDGTREYVRITLDDRTVQNQWCIAFAFRTADTTLPSGDTYFAGAGEGTVPAILNNSRAFFVGIATSGVIKTNLWSDANISSGLTGSTNIVDGQWHWIECDFRADDTSGVLRIRIDGVDEINISGDSVDGTDATEWMNTWFFSNNTLQDQTYYVDDIVVYNDVSSGITGDLTDTNFPIGDHRIETITPDSTGTAQQLEGFGTSTSTNYLNVDENVPDDDTSYNYSTTSGAVDTYGFSSLSGTVDTITTVNIWAHARNAETGSIALRGVSVSNASSIEALPRALGAAYASYQYAVPYDPDTSTRWLSTALDAAEFGVEVRATTST